MGRPFPVALLEYCEAEGASACFFPPSLLSRNLGFAQPSLPSRSGRLERDHAALPTREKGNKIKIYRRRPSLWRGFFRPQAILRCRCGRSSQSQGKSTWRFTRGICDRARMVRLVFSGRPPARPPRAPEHCIIRCDAKHRVRRTPTLRIAFRTTMEILKNAYEYLPIYTRSITP
jgi:hypothetical protein